MNWYIRHIYAAYKTVAYKLPTDPQQMIYDFYMSSFLYHAPQNYKNENLYHIVSEIKSSLLSSMKEKMLNDVLFSINCELRHAKSYVDEGSIFDVLSDDDAELFSDFYNKYQNIKQNTGLRDNQRRGVSANYDYANLAMDDVVGKDRQKQQQAVQMALHVFQGLKWHDSYGGPAWAEICQGWLELFKANDEGHNQAYIDHIVDLQHNTGSLFNKLLSYAKQSPAGSYGRNDYAWIQQSLDHKKAVKNPFELLPFCSPTMKMIAARAIKDTSNLTMQSSGADIISYWMNISLADPRTVDTLPDDVAFTMIKSPQFKQQMMQMMVANYGTFLLVEKSPLMQKMLSFDEMRALWQGVMKVAPFSVMNHSQQLQKYLTPQELHDFVLQGLMGNLNHMFSVTPEMWALLTPDDITNIFSANRVDSQQTLDSIHRMPPYVLEKLPAEWYTDVFKHMLATIPGELLYQMSHIFMEKVPREIVTEALTNYLGENYSRLKNLLDRPDIMGYLGVGLTAQMVLPLLSKSPVHIDRLPPMVYEAMGGDAKAIEIWKNYLATQPHNEKQQYSYYMNDAVRAALFTATEPTPESYKRTVTDALARAWATPMSMSDLSPELYQAIGGDKLAIEAWTSWINNLLGEGYTFALGHYRETMNGAVANVIFSLYDGQTAHLKNPVPQSTPASPSQPMDIYGNPLDINGDPVDQTDPSDRAVYPRTND